MLCGKLSGARELVHERNWRHLLRSNFIPVGSALVFGFLVRRRRYSKSRNLRNRVNLPVSFIFALELTWNIANSCIECVPLFAL